MQKVEVVWADEIYGHFHVYLDLDRNGRVVVLIVEPRNLSVVKSYPYEEFVENLPEALKMPFKEALKKLYKLKVRMVQMVKAEAR